MVPVFGGGEFLCLNVCLALQERGYHVKLVCDIFDPEMAEEVYGMGSVMKRCEHVPIPEFVPKKAPLPGLHLYAIQRLIYQRRIRVPIESIEANVAFSTQSSVFSMKDKQIYHFLYNIIDLFSYPASLTDESKRGSGFRWRAYYWGLNRLRNLLIGDPSPDFFFALSEGVHADLVSRGYPNSTTIFPPARMDFHPLAKKKQVITVSRIVKPKRLEMFFEIARRLPQYPFYLIGRNAPELRALEPGYSDALFKNMPSNVHYIESPIKQVPRYLQESKVYLYCGVEPGIGIAIMEACGAGCVPVTPNAGGGREVVDAIGEGYTFRDVDEAVRAVEAALLGDDIPERIAEKARERFSPEAFRSKIMDVLKD